MRRIIVAKNNTNYYCIIVIVVTCVQAIWMMTWQSHELQVIFQQTNSKPKNVVANKEPNNTTTSTLKQTLLTTNTKPDNQEPNNTTTNTLKQTPSSIQDNQETPNTSTTTNSEKEKLNVLLLYADDWRFDTLGVAGNPIVQTPVLDQLAQTEGMRFTENCVTTSVCWCSRATLWTGLYTARHKTYRPRDIDGFSWNETIYSLFQQKYHVGHVGKWGVWHNYGSTLPYNMPAEGWHKRQMGSTEIHITEKNTADSLRFLKERPSQQPFFLVTSYFATHAVDGDKRQYLPMNSSSQLYNTTTIPMPRTNTEQHWQDLPRPVFSHRNEGRIRYNWRFNTPTKHQQMMKNYYRMATEVDTSIGLLLQELKNQGIYNQTLIVFTTDNGNFHSEHGLADKWYPHQESIKVPLIIVDPRMPPHKKGTTSNALTLNIDLAPTLLSAAGIQPLPHMMGRDISQLYLSSNTTTTWRDDFFYEHPVHRSKESIPASEALVTKDYKYILWPDYNIEQLFHLPSDPYEETDLIKHPQHAHILSEKLKPRFQHLKHMIQNTNENLSL